MKILYSVSNFRYLTGAELYVYELAREALSAGHEVVILAQTELAEGEKNELKSRIENLGAKVFDFKDYEAKLFAPDILHVQQAAPSKLAIDLYPNTPAVATVHSEFPVENPYIHENIKHYICIRPSIQDKIVVEDKIDREKTSVIYNPIDFDRFNNFWSKSPAEEVRKKQVLFVGTIDYLRRAAIMDLIQRALAEDFELTIVGRKFESYLDFELPRNVNWNDQVWDIENFVKYCDETAGIVMGRTTIEGWACGKPGWIYDVKPSGEIVSRTKFEIPEYMEDFDSKLVFNYIKEKYNAILS